MQSSRVTSLYKIQVLKSTAEEQTLLIIVVTEDCLIVSAPSHSYLKYKVRWWKIDFFLDM
jgi:hypothetical protein